MRQGFGIRLGAALLDVIIVLGLLLVLGFATGGSMFAIFQLAGGGAEGERAAEAVGLGFLVLTLIVIGGYSLTEIFLAGTPGKLALGLRIGDASGIPATVGQLTTRWITKNAGSLLQTLGEIMRVGAIESVGKLASLVIFVGCFFVLGQARQALHDKIAGTAVFKKEVVMRGRGPQGFEVLSPNYPPPAPPPH